MYSSSNPRGSSDPEEKIRSSFAVTLESVEVEVIGQGNVAFAAVDL